MTAKILVKTEVVDCTRGVSREQRAIDRGKKRDSPLSSVRGHRKRSSAVPKRDSVNFDDEKHKALVAYYEQRHAELAKRYGGVPDKVATDFTFEEKPFGCELKTSANDTKKAQVLSRIVVSLALFDGDKMLFSCSGIPIPDRRNPSTLCLTSFVTSARLAREFNANRYKNDKLRVEVRLPHGKAVIGFLGLYDEDIAIVTCICSLDVHPVGLDCDVALDPQARQVCHDDDRVKAIGCLFKSGTLMTTGGCLVRERPYTWVSETQDLSEAVLGGPLIVAGHEVRFLGMNNEYYGDANVTFLSKNFLHGRLEHFQILNPKELHFRGYSLPKDVYRIEPSGLNSRANHRY